MLQYYHYLSCNFVFQLWIFKYFQNHFYHRPFYVICSSYLFDVTLLPFYSPKYDTNQFRKFNVEKQNLTFDFLSSWGMYIKWKFVLFGFDFESLVQRLDSFSLGCLKFHMVEQVRSIQEMMVCVQVNGSTFSSTIRWFCQLIKTKKKLTAVLSTAFMPSSGVW